METKEAWPGTFLFFQIGDFFELFFEDAEAAAPLLDLTLTSRQKIDGVPVPMCGVPIAAGESYVNRLAALGHRVVVFEQEAPAAVGEKLARRRLSRVVTPGTIVSEDGPSGRYMAVILNEGALAALTAAAGPTAKLAWHERVGDADRDGDAARRSGGSAAAKTAPGAQYPDSPPGGWWFMAAADLSTGDFQLARAADFESLTPEISTFAPAEILYPSPCPPELDAFLKRSGTYSLALGPEAFAGAGEALAEVFGNGFLENLPELSATPGGPAACGAAVKRLLELAPGSRLSHLAPPRLLWTAPALSMDEAALRNLELVRSLRDGSRKGTLLELVDLSATPMGSRTLQDWLVRPSRDRATVEARHAAVEELLADSSARDRLQEALKSLKDLERALSRLTLGRGAVRDLYQVKAALDLAPGIRDLLSGMKEGGLLRRIADEIGRVLGDRPPVPPEGPVRCDAGPAPPGEAHAVAPEASGASVCPGPSAVPDAPSVRPVPEASAFPVPPGPEARAIRTLMRALELCLKVPRDPGTPDGAAVRDGCSPVLDELRELERDGRKAIAALEGREKARTGLNSLRVGYNRVFGYYLEIPRRHADGAPEDWTRRQTLATSERYASPELIELEGRLLTAGESREELEQTILKNLKDRAASASAGAKGLSRLLGQADALRSLAEAARRNRWIRPRITADDVIDIKNGRHPVVEASLPRGEAFVANDVRLSPKERILIVTGPNMAGKSTVLRQTAIIVVLCQMGSFVPAESAKLSIRDAVFTRVGAADDLARGRSTFMVEMSETARILARATPRSLVVLDEVGRGTSTFDGLAIAWAVAEYLHDRAGRGVPTLFATHYHELVDLARSKPLTVNYNVAVRKWQGKVIFLRKLLPGGTSRSYGLAVAALAGLPKAVTERAAEVLKDLLEGAKRSIRPQIRPRGLFADLEEAPSPEPQGLWAPDALEEPDRPAAQARPPAAPDARPATPGHDDASDECPSGRSHGLNSGQGADDGPGQIQDGIQVPARDSRSAAGPGEAAAFAAPGPLIPGAGSPEEDRDRLIAEIGSLDTESLTPLEALNLVHSLKTRAGRLL
jgi:DNA mismatch repair protein MutS